MLKENFVNAIERSFIQNWDSLCFGDYGGEPVTFSVIAKKVKELHAVFEVCGIEKGDRIALAGKNSSNWGTVYLATVSYGAVIVPILSDFQTDEIHHFVNHSQSKLFFAAGTIYDRIDDAKMEKLTAIFKLDSFEMLFSPGDDLNSKVAERIKAFRESDCCGKENFKVAKCDNSDFAAIVYTSGTTGFSKGVMLSGNCLMANVRFFIDNLPIKKESRVLSFLPLAHCFGCAFDFLSPFIKGCHITFLGRIPSPKIILKAFSEIKPDVIFAVPLILEKIYRAKIMPLLETTKMKVLLNTPGLNKLIYKKIGKSINDAFGGTQYEIVVGGAAFNPDIEKFFMKAGVRVTVGYGMTECGPLITYTDYYQGRPLGSCGKVMTYLEMKIDSPNDKGIGEICVKGENVMSGYFRMDDETTETIDSDGWLHTGDLGHIDDGGFLFISGRSKNMILSGSGQNIYPEEIEAKLNYMPYVGESIVLDGGEGKLIALVYPDKEKMDKNGVKEISLENIMEENRKELNEKLPAFAMIKKIRIYPEEFEKTSTKKIKRRLYTSLVKSD